MRKTDNSFPRRDFLAAAPAVVFGSRIFSRPFHSIGQEKKALPEAVSPEETKLIESSAMAKDLSGFFGKGYSCSESILMVSLRHMKKDEDLVWAAAGFGGRCCGIIAPQKRKSRAA